MGRPIVSGQLKIDSELEQTIITGDGSNLQEQTCLDPFSSIISDETPPSPTWSTASSSSSELTVERFFPPLSDEALVVRVLGLASDLSGAAKAILLPELSLAALRRVTRFEEVDLVPGTLTLRAWGNSEVIDYVRMTDEEIDEMEADWEMQQEQDFADDSTDMDEDAHTPSDPNVQRARANGELPCDPDRFANRARGLATQLGLGQVDLALLRGTTSNTRTPAAPEAPAALSFQRSLPVTRATLTDGSTRMRSRRTVIGPYHVATRGRAYDVNSDSDDEVITPIHHPIRAHRTAGPLPPLSTSTRSDPSSSVPAVRAIARAHRSAVLRAAEWDDRRPRPPPSSSSGDPSFDPNGETFNESDFESPARSATAIGDVEFLDTPPLTPRASSPSGSVFPTSGIFHSHTLDIPLSDPPPPRRSTAPLPPRPQVFVRAPPGRVSGGQARLGQGWAEAARGGDRMTIA